MNKKPEIFLRHILESLKQIEHYTEEYEREDFWDRPEIQDAVIRRFEIIGEATKNIPEDFRKAHPEVAWQEAIGMRNVLIHEYFGVDLDIVWNTVEEILPKFKEQIEDLLEKTKKERE